MHRDSPESSSTYSDSSQTRGGVPLRQIAAQVGRILGRIAPGSLGRASVLALLLVTSTLTSIAQAGLGMATPLAIAQAHAQAATGAHGTPNRFDPHMGTTSVGHSHLPQQPNVRQPSLPRGTLLSHAGITMQPGGLALRAGQSAHFVSSDGRLELSVPSGAVSSADVAAAGGALNLRITQIAPASGSSAGGSGHVSFGTYLFQLTNASGVLVQQGLRAPITLAMHYGHGESAFDLAHAVVVFNAALPEGVQAASTTAAVATSVTPNALQMGRLATHLATLDHTHNTLSTAADLSTGSTTASFDTNSPVASFGKPDPFNVNLSAAALTFAQPIDVPQGPGGLTPPVALSYSSESVDEQHSIQAAAPWVGEGWNLGLGAISWAEHNSTAGCTSGCGNGWEDSWQLSDPFGTASELIPPNINIATYYEDSTNTPASSWVQWHTAVESHAKVFSYVGPLTLPTAGGTLPLHPPCFRVYLPNGIMEEFGCTADSLQYYYNAATAKSYIANWFLDLITDSEGNQIHVTYQRDMATVSGVSYPRDVQLATIEYDSPGCDDAQTMCTGTSWAPLMRVNFLAGHSPSRLTNAQTGCNTGANLRCDDPKDLSASGGLGAPQVQSTLVLNDIQVQVRGSASASWNTLRDYAFGYEQSGPGTITDPLTGLTESTAGMLDLTQVYEIGDDGTNALLYSGHDNSATQSYAYTKAFDLSSKNVVIGPTTTLSYWIFPQSSTGFPGISGSNSTCVAIDMIFTDGSDLRDSGAVDQNGNKLHPASQCGHLQLDQWNHVVSDIGAAASGKTISRIDVGYDQPANTGSYRGYLDDISLANPDSSTPLFATGLENADPQPTWTSTVDTGPGAGGNISNVTGICCNLSGPELFAAFVAQGGVTAHNTTLPMRTFTYTRQDQHYEDSARHATPSSNCGPGWNTSCFLWSQSFSGNNRYLSSASNGLGLTQTFTWAEGRNNTHGVGSGGDPTDTLYCDTHQSGYPCNEADDQNWSHIVLTSQTGSVVRPSSGGNSSVDSTTSYRYALTLIGEKPCSDCIAGYDWGNQNDNDFLDFYNAKFQGYTQVTVTNPDGAVDVHKFFATEGLGLYDTGQISCMTSSPCHNDPWWLVGNALHGHEYEVDSYDTDGATLLTQRKTGYQVICPPSGVAPTPASSSFGNWGGHLVSELDHGNPVAVCDIQTQQADTFTWDGAASTTAVPHKTEVFTYDSYGRRITTTTTSNDGGATGSPTTIVERSDPVWNDALTPTATGVTGTYLIDFVADSDVRDSANTQHLSCQFMSYDNQTYTGGQTSTLTQGEETAHDAYASCGTAASGFTDASGQIRTTYVYDPHGNQTGTIDPDANAGISGHAGCGALRSVSRVDPVVISASSCTTFDGTFASLPIGDANALDQETQLGYSATPAGGFGLWPTSTTDANGQKTTTAYDALGRVISTTLPGETSGLTTTSTSYTVWCSGTAAQTPCIEIDTTQRLDSQTTVTSRAFYDGWGNLVETRAAAPGGQDVVQYADYDRSGRRIFLSIPYFVAAYSGGPGASAFAVPDASQAGTSTTYTNRLSTTVTDALSNSTLTTYSVLCGKGDDSACYVVTAVVDPLSHVHTTFTDALGRTAFTLTYTGTSSGVTLSNYALTKFSYDLAGNTTQILQPNGSSKTTYTYDAAGRKIGMSDPDRGTESYSYDQNGNLIKSVDARGSNGTVFMGYDGLNRQLWRNTSNTPTGAYVSYTYDDTTNGNLGVGRLTREHFTGGPTNQLSGIYNYVYDPRGQQVQATLTIGGIDYPLKSTFDDAGHVLTQTYPGGEVVTTGYTPQGWLLGMATTQAGTTTTLLDSARYSGSGGAAGQLTGATLGNGTYTYAASFDLLGRATDLKYTLSSSGATLFESQPGYDAAGNVSSVKTTLPQGSDQQLFCYDEFNRLAWAGSTGTAPCTGAVASGSLSAAKYTQSFAYDTMNRLTSSPLGTYTYGDSAHLHAATSIGSGYTASYDASGSMTCRAPTSSTTCAGSNPTGAQLAYDNEGHLVGWQDAPTAPTNTDGFLYDGEGNRVEQQVTQSGVTSSILYIGTAEEATLSPSGTTTRTFYYAGDKRIALAVNGVFSYLGTDVLGSATVALSASGAVQASQLYAPYGTTRYSNGLMPTSYGFTGQRGDALTGLDYYGARYYDPQAGQFTSADTDDQGGLNRYGYVKGNPETLTDPTGRRVACGPDGCGTGGGSSNGSSSTPPPSPPPPPVPPYHAPGHGYAPPPPDYGPPAPVAHRQPHAPGHGYALYRRDVVTSSVRRAQPHAPGHGYAVDRTPVVRQTTSDTPSAHRDKQALVVDWVVLEFLLGDNVTASQHFANYVGGSMGYNTYPWRPLDYGDAMGAYRVQRILGRMLPPEEAPLRGMGIIRDFPLNHTSDSGPWDSDAGTTTSDVYAQGGFGVTPVEPPNTAAMGIDFGSVETEVM